MTQDICKTLATEVDRMVPDVNEAQELQFKLMKFASFNSFNGHKVVKALRENRHLWRGAIFGRFERIEAVTLHLKPGETYKPLCAWADTLRDIPSGLYSADTLYVTPVTGMETELERLAKTWRADEITWETVPHVGKSLCVWWD